jgi:hypothetical protein
MNSKLLSIFPGSLYERSTGHIEDLLLHVNFYKQLSLLLSSNQILECMGVLVANLSKFGEPCLERPMIVLGYSCHNTSTIVVASDNDIFDLKDFYCILNDCQRRNIRGRDNISNVS